MQDLLQRALDVLINDTLAVNEVSLQRREQLINDLRRALPGKIEPCHYVATNGRVYANPNWKPEAHLRVGNLPAGEWYEAAVHMSHCNQGESLGSCKYGEEGVCPALKPN